MSVALGQTLIAFTFLPYRNGKLSGIDVAKYLRESCNSRLLAMTNGIESSVLTSEDHVYILLLLEIFLQGVVCCFVCSSQFDQLLLPKKKQKRSPYAPPP